jgi:hypothetical protein
MDGKVPNGRIRVVDEDCFGRAATSQTASSAE